MKLGYPYEYELPDDLVIGVGDGDGEDADHRMGAGSTLPQDYFALGESGAISNAVIPSGAFSPPRVSTEPLTQPASLNTPAARQVIPEGHIAQTPPIIAPMPPKGRLASDGPQAKRVLVVDDDATARHYLRSRLMLRGHVQLHEAASGAQALELVMTQRFDALLLDVDMGGQNGYEVCRAVRSHMRSVGSKQPRIYMITSRTSMLDKMRAKMAGADAFLTKPPHPGELAELLAQL